MTNKKSLPLIFSFGVFLLTAAAQQSRIDPDAVPVDKEPRHHLVFTNDFVRVVDARFEPGYKSLSHTHSQDNVAITISPGRNDAASQARIGRAGFSKGGYSHTVTNSGDIELRFIDVEILRADKPNGTAFPNSARHMLETENDRVRIYRIKLAPGESMPSHHHTAGWLAVTVTGGPGPGSYRWNAGGTDNPVTAGASAVEIVELEPR